VAQQKLVKAIREVSAPSDIKLYKVIDERFPVNTYISSSNIFQEILYQPHLAGVKFQQKLSKASEELVRIIAHVALKSIPKKDICELVFLAGGLYYGLNEGFKKMFVHSLPQCFIGIQRDRIEGAEGEFRARASYENFESLPENASVIIGDTVATGTTLLKGLQLLANAAEQKKRTIKKVVVCSIAASAKGAEMMKHAENSLASRFPGVKCYFIACEQLFHLMPDGTDLRFNMPGSIIPESTGNKTLDIYGHWLSKNMKCAIFDWGTRCKNPMQHYREFLQYAEKERQSPSADEKGRLILSKMIQDIYSEIKGLEEPLKYP